MTRISKQKGFVYCLTNPSFKANLYKVGFTVHDPILRANQLYKTGLPTPFKILFAKHVDDYKQKENLLHRIMESCGKRVNSQREFFECDVSLIKNLFELAGGEWYEGKTTESATEIVADTKVTTAKTNTKVTTKVTNAAKVDTVRRSLRIK